MFDHGKETKDIVESMKVNHCLQELKAENQRLKDTNRRLNRRCQRAESAANATIVKAEQAGASLGRCLLRYAYSKTQKDNQKLKQENRRLRDALEEIQSVMVGYKNEFKVDDMDFDYGLTVLDEIISEKGIFE